MRSETALVLLWHYTQTPSPNVPAWAREHPDWPAFHDWKTGHLRRAAKPLIEVMEAALNTDLEGSSNV